MSNYQYPQTHYTAWHEVNIADQQHLPKRLLDQLETPYNHLYEGWREITECEFTRSGFFNVPIVATQYKQVMLPSEQEKGSRSIRAFLFQDGAGVAMSQDYWQGKIRYFAFGCQHEFKEETIGRCLHQHTCIKCGFVQIIDSSD